MSHVDGLRVRVALFLAIALALSSVAFFTTAPASAVTETIIPTVEAAPGTVSGNPGDLTIADDVRVEIAQQDVTAIVDANVWLKPDGDMQSGWVPYGCGVNANFGCMDDDPVHDGNVSILVSPSGIAQEDQYTLEDWPLGTDVTIASMTVWSWARQNDTGVTSYLLTFVEYAGPGEGEGAFDTCTSAQPTLTQAFGNYSATFVERCAGGAWTPGSVSLTTYDQLGGFELIDLTTTAGGARVTYSDSDFQVVAYLNFTSIPCPGGCDYELRWEGYEDGPDAALLQIDADGVWTTVVTLDPSGDTDGSYVIPAEYADTGAIRFRIVDTVTDGETGGNVYLDLFAVDVTPQGGGGTGLPPVEVSCEYRWTSGILNCTSIVRVAESLIDGRIWTLGDRVVAQGRPGSPSIDIRVGAGLAPFRGTWNVTFRVVTVVGSVLIARTVAVADSMWLWAVYGLIVLVVIIAIANRYRPPRPRAEPPKEMHRERERRGREGFPGWR